MANLFLWYLLAVVLFGALAAAVENRLVLKRSLRTWLGGGNVAPLSFRQWRRALNDWRSGMYYGDIRGAEIVLIEDRIALQEEISRSRAANHLLHARIDELADALVDAYAGQMQSEPTLGPAPQVAAQEMAACPTS